MLKFKILFLFISLVIFKIQNISQRKSKPETSKASTSKKAKLSDKENKVKKEFIMKTKKNLTRDIY